MNRTRVYLGILTLLLATLLTPMQRISAAPLQNGAAAETKDQPYVIEYYYKVKWGHAEEFLTLFKKNHYPILKKEMETGPHSARHHDLPAPPHAPKTDAGITA